ncbi:site-specific integrase [Paraburkholderia sp. UYCP14C]|uniref:site-specific integrase n=1 Tax=Paraburkholderia sp. UYCP14C TaxID=2511130 RepID=UPI00101F05F7|nr:site-specific integrase [Paraburkholderia sp. UYCP14C]RZF27584.1 site-specific integrase [Paraburkholderia sp. UYCP14C]
MATIRQRNDRWQAIVKRKGHPVLTKTFDLKKDAERWSREQERLIDTGLYVDDFKERETTLTQLLDRYATEVSSGKRGSRAESYRIESFKKLGLAKHALSAITPQMVASWRDARLHEVSSGTALRELQLLGHIFSIAMREWGFRLQSNPVSLIRKPRSGKARDRVLTPAERAALISACGQCHNPWIRPVVIFALETAARRGEILSVTWDDVDLARRTATLQATKAGQPRRIPLSTACVTMLEALPRSLDGRVFPVSMETVKQAYERAVVRAGIANFTFHDLRHDALTRLAKQGLSILELRAISGHTTANMLQRYVSIDAGELAMKLG